MIKTKKALQSLGTKHKVYFMTKSIDQVIVSGLSGKTITEAKLTDDRTLVLLFKSGERFSIGALPQKLEYASSRPQPKTKVDKLVKASEEALKLPKKRSHQKKAAEAKG